MEVNQQQTKPEACSTVKFSKQEVRDILKGWLIQKGYAINVLAKTYLCMDRRSESITLAASCEGSCPPIIKSKEAGT